MKKRLKPLSKKPISRRRKSRSIVKRKYVRIKKKKPFIEPLNSMPLTIIAVEDSKKKNTPKIEEKTTEENPYLAMVKNYDHYQKLKLAKNEETDPNILIALADEEDVKIKIELIKNSATPLSIIKKIAPVVFGVEHGGSSV